MFTFVMDVIIVVLKSVMIFLHRRWWKIIGMFYKLTY